MYNKNASWAGVISQDVGEGPEAGEPEKKVERDFLAELEASKSPILSSVQMSTSSNASEVQRQFDADKHQEYLESVRRAA